MRQLFWKSNISIMLGASVLLLGCESSKTIWSAESRSPDGKVIVEASTVVRGRGLSVVSNTITDVQLKSANGSPRQTSVLELADATVDPADTRVEMNWLTSTHLELTVKGNQNIVHQSVNWDGIDISIRDLSKAAVESENATRRLAPTAPPSAYEKTNPRH
jgi:hypothetical protein